jgi:hypothetical protein
VHPTSRGGGQIISNEHGPLQMFQSVVQSSRESNNKKYRLRYPVLHPTISMTHVKIKLISHITKKKKSFISYLNNRYTVHYVTPYVASSRFTWLEGERTYVLRIRSVLVMRDDDENRHGGSRKCWFARHSATRRGHRPPKILPYCHRGSFGFCIS